MDEYNRKIEEYNLLDEVTQSTTSFPDLPKLWTATAVAQREDFKQEYRRATSEEKEAWRSYIESTRAPENNKKSSTLASHDIATVNRNLAKMVRSINTSGSNLHI